MGVNKVRGMYTCDVCGRDFPLIAECGCHEGGCTGEEGGSDGE